jgi:hypothetical protein
MYIEVEANPNCAGREGMRYRELGPPSPVVRVRIFDRRDEGEWCLVTAVQGEGATPWGPALARRVEDSGVGVAYLVFGGAWGIRLCPVDRARPWSFDNSDQWGEPYLLLTDSHDLVLAEPG